MRVLLVYGAGSGLGKSTLAGAIATRLQSEGTSTSLFTEESAVHDPAFRAYAEQVRAGNGADARVLLECCERFVADLAHRDAEVAVVDSLLPCWDWLYSAGATDAVVFKFTKRLTDLLRGLRPILVLVEADLLVALRRAVGERGNAWALDLAQLRTGARDRTLLHTYFRDLRAATERAVAHWDHPIVRVDTEAQCLEASVDATLESLSG